jgi:hypothetical protein
MGNWATVSEKRGQRVLVPAKPVATKFVINVHYTSRGKKPWSVFYKDICHPCDMVEFLVHTKTMYKPGKAREPRGFITAYGTVTFKDGKATIRP